MRSCFILLLFLLAACGSDGIPIAGGPSLTQSKFDPGTDPDLWCNSVISNNGWSDGTNTYVFQKDGCKLLKNGSTIANWWHRAIDSIGVKLDPGEKVVCGFSMERYEIRCPFAAGVLKPL